MSTYSKAQDVVIDVNDLGPRVENAMFGANIVYTWSNFDRLDLIENKTDFYGIRFPGGSVAENELNLQNPDQYLSYQSAGPVPPFKSIGRYIEEVNAYNWKAIFVLPTKRFVGNEAQGAAEIQAYVEGILSGAYGTIENGRTIHFEIGNEFFWGQDQISASDYGSIAVQWINAIEAAKQSTGRRRRVEISVQSGLTDDQAADVARAFHGKNERNAIDYLTYHLYPGRTEIQLGMWPLHQKKARFRDRLEDIRQEWVSASGVDVPFFLSEYNIRNRDNPSFDHGLKNPMGFMSLFAESVRARTTMSTVWPIVSANGLRTRFFNWNTSPTFNGTMYTWMETYIRRRHIVNGIQNNTYSPSANNFRTEGAYVEAFTSGNNLVIFVHGTEHDQKQFTIEVEGFEIDRRNRCELMYTDAGQEGNHQATVKTRRIWPRIWDQGRKVTFTLNRDSKYEVARIVLRGRRVAAAQARISSNESPNLFEAAADVMKPNLQLFPNPSSDFIYLTSDQPLTSVAIHDASGRFIQSLDWSTKEEDDHRISIRHLSAGTYLLISKAADGQTTTTTFVKQ